jgi:hypothetical protein
MGLGIRAAYAIAATSVVVAGAFVMSPSATATTHVVRYAGPTGVSSTTCPKTEPCDLPTAINSAPAGSEVILLPGSYDSAEPLTTGLTDTNGDIYIHGEAGKPAPVINSAASSGAIAIRMGSRLSGVKLSYSGSNSSALIVSDGSADHVLALSTANPNHPACLIDTTLTDSACVNDAPDGYAVEPGGNANFDVSLRGVTAEATGTGSVGLVLNTTSSHLAVTATNSIIHGTFCDIQENLNNPGDGDTEAVNLTHSDYKTVTTNTPATGESLTPDATDVSASPKFVNLADLNFAEVAGSPTVNKGAADPTHDTDLAGSPRTIGSAPDMGAYELLQKPAVGRPKATRKRATTAVFAVKVNSEGAATRVHLVAAHGHRLVTSATVSVPPAARPKTIRLTLRGLSRRTKYAVHAVAENFSGHADSPTATLTTPKH